MFLNWGAGGLQAANNVIKNEINKALAIVTIGLIATEYIALNIFIFFIDIDIDIDIDIEI